MSPVYLVISSHASLFSFLFIIKSKPTLNIMLCFMYVYLLANREIALWVESIKQTLLCQKGQKWRLLSYASYFNCYWVTVTLILDLYAGEGVGVINLNAYVIWMFDTTSLVELGHLSMVPSIEPLSHYFKLMQVCVWQCIWSTLEN